eukprot:1142563-Pelagomonas_calceolata.AAC.3
MQPHAKKGQMTPFDMAWSFLANTAEQAASRYVGEAVQAGGVGMEGAPTASKDPTAAATNDRGRGGKGSDATFQGRLLRRVQEPGTGEEARARAGGAGLLGGDRPGSKDKTKSNGSGCHIPPSSMYDQGSDGCRALFTGHSLQSASAWSSHPHEGCSAFCGRAKANEKQWLRLERKQGLSSMINSAMRLEINTCVMGAIRG